MVNNRIRVPANQSSKSAVVLSSTDILVPTSSSVTINVSLRSYGSDSNSVLQEIPTSHALPIVGEYVPG
jgi:hypothetical protein